MEKLEKFRSKYESAVNLCMVTYHCGHLKQNGSIKKKVAEFSVRALFKVSSKIL